MLTEMVAIERVTQTQKRRPSRADGPSIGQRLDWKRL
jgi:hypothetical protein